VPDIANESNENRNRNSLETHFTGRKCGCSSCTFGSFQPSKRVQLQQGQQKALKQMVKMFAVIRREIDAGAAHFTLKTLIEFIVEAVNYRSYLEKTHSPDLWEGKWEVVQQLCTLAEEREAVWLAEEEKPHYQETAVLDGSVSRKNLVDSVFHFLEDCSLDPSSFFRDNKEQDNPTSSVGNSVRENQGTLTISTIHAAKGLEWDAVFVCGCHPGVMPHVRATSVENIEEERRLAYVAMTRAKLQLYLTFSSSKHPKNSSHDPSSSTSTKEIKLGGCSADQGGKGTEHFSMGSGYDRDRQKLMSMMSPFFSSLPCADVRFFHNSIEKPQPGPSFSYDPYDVHITCQGQKSVFPCKEAIGSTKAERKTSAPDAIFQTASRVMQQANNKNRFFIHRAMSSTVTTAKRKSTLLEFSSDQLASATVERKKTLLGFFSPKI